MKSRTEKIEQAPNPATAEMVKHMPDYIQLTEDYAKIKKTADELKEKIQWREILRTALQSARAGGDAKKIGELAEKIMNVSGEITALARTIDRLEDTIIQEETPILQSIMNADETLEQ